MKLILLGAPGAGKGTQAEVICKELDIPAISTGNIIREAMKNGTKAGLEAKSYVESGGLVPDEIVLEMLKERLAQDDCKNGYILDGFPRNLKQAEALDRMGIVIDKVISIEISDDAIVERLTGRRVCQDCGSSYHTVYKPSKDGELCDKCTGRLIIRKDDEPETVLNRLKTYHELTEPLKEYYGKSGKLRPVESQEEVLETTKLTLKALEA
ncbi:MAG: adenylate kinase [Oscillospiraceae bacterium]|nr:adenylate kinase [Oscillospiraceae bacterium]